MERLDGVVDELALIPSTRFLRLSHAPKRAVVVGPRIALIDVVRWPPGRYTWRRLDTDVRRDGEPFYPAAKQFDAALNSIESRVAPADLRLFVVVETEDVEKIELTVPAGGRITFARQETLVEQVGVPRTYPSCSSCSSAGIVDNLQTKKRT